MTTAKIDTSPRQFARSWRYDESAHGISGSNLWLVALLTVLLGILAVYLNRVLYSNQAPFFDSLSYYDKLYRVMSRTNAEGLFAGFGEALYGSNTVCLPYLIAVPLAYFVRPCRDIGVLIQIAELFFFLWSLDIFLRRVTGARRGVRAAIIASFLAIACLYFPNGGLSDFRMDMSLMLFYGTSCLWLMISIKGNRISDFVLLGVAIGVTCLLRATAPVYFAISLGPIVVWELAKAARSPRSTRSETAGRLVCGFALALVTSLAVAGWYFVLNFRFLYFYYAVWNTDANANLPLSESLKHLELAKRSFGDAAMVLLVSIAIVVVVRSWRARDLRKMDLSGDQVFEVSPSPKQRASATFNLMLAGLDWRLIWLAVGPLMFLVVRGAGLNPFVSMPVVIGWFIAIGGWSAVQFRESNRIEGRIIWSMIAVCVLVAGVRGWTKHASSSNGSMSSHLRILDAVAADAARLGKKRVHFSTVQISEISTSSLWSVLLFDHPRAHRDGIRVHVGGVQLMPSQTFFQPADVDWRMVAGENDDAKIVTLVGLAERDVDYLIVPAPETIPVIMREVGVPVINRHMDKVRRQLLVGDDWTVIESRIRGMPGRDYDVFRRDVDTRVASDPPIANR